MAYDDGYYYGQCKIVAVVDDTADNGKTVLITTDDNKTYSGTIANKKCEFLLPPRTLYTVQKVSGESVEFTTKVEAGYGDCILVHLNTGYVEVKQGDIVGLDYIKAATADNLKNKVPEATAVKELDSRLLANDKKFQFAYDSSKGSYGYLIDGTFKSFNDATALYKALQYSGLVTPDMTYEEMLQVLANHFPNIPATFNYISSTASGDWKGYSNYASAPVSISKNSYNIVASCTIGYSISWFYMYCNKGYEILKNSAVLNFESVASIYCDNPSVARTVRVQISTDLSNWGDLFSTSATGGSGNSPVQFACNKYNVSLKNYVGKKVYFRIYASSGTNMQGPNGKYNTVTVSKFNISYS